MIVIDDKPYMVFRKDGQYGAMYSIGISKKNQDNTYTNGYLPVRFRKDTNIENKTNIYIKKSFWDFYIDKNKKTNLYLFISEFNTVEDTIKESKKEEQDPYQEFSEEHKEELDGLELPF